MVDPWDPTPLYRQIADEIARRIESGDLLPGKPIGSEASIVQEFGVARMTARRAIRELVDRGLVIVLPGRGSFVRPDPAE